MEKPTDLKKTQAEINSTIREMMHAVLKKDLNIRITERPWSHEDAQVEIQLTLAGEDIGDPIFLGISTDGTHQHSCDHITNIVLKGE